MDAYTAFTETEESRIFPNESFGYRKVKVERPLRLRSQLSDELIDRLRWASGDEQLRREIHALVGEEVFTDFSKVEAKVKEHLEGSEDDEESTSVSAKVLKRLMNAKKWARDYRLCGLAQRLAAELGTKQFDDHNDFIEKVDVALKSWGEKLAAGDRKALLRGVSWADQDAPKVVKKVSKPEKVPADPLGGLFAVEIAGKTMTVEYEADPDLSDFEQVPLPEAGGVDAFITREVLPYAPDAWVDRGSEKIGYEVSFTKVFYKPVQLRSLAQIEADIKRVMHESDGLVLAALGSRG
jgi:type I restriction enzyme M protein